MVRATRAHPLKSDCGLVQLYSVYGLAKESPQRLVIDSDDRKAEILTELHEEFGHKGRESTYRRVADRYYWDGCYEDVRGFVASCERCQLRDPRCLEEAFHPTWSSALFEKIGLDVVQ